MPITAGQRYNKIPCRHCGELIGTNGLAQWSHARVHQGVRCGCTNAGKRCVIAQRLYKRWHSGARAGIFAVYRDHLSQAKICPGNAQWEL